MPRLTRCLILAAALSACAPTRPATVADASAWEEYAECDKCDLVVHCASRVKEAPCPAKCSNGHVVHCRHCAGIY